MSFKAQKASGYDQEIPQSHTGDLPRHGEEEPQNNSNH